MRILVATNDQADGPGTEPHGFLCALNRLGHETSVFYYRKKDFFYSNFRKLWVRHMNARLLEHVRSWQADLLLVFRGGYISASTIKTINRTTSCLTVNIYPDNPWGMASLYPALPFEAIRSYRLFLTKDRYFEGGLRSQGLDNARYLPHGYDPEFYKPTLDQSEEKCRFSGAEVSFVGTPYPFRVGLLDGIVGMGADLRIWGNSNWSQVESPRVRERYQGKYLSLRACVSVYATSGINLDLQHPGGGVMGLGERSFRIVGSGGFLMLNHWEPVKEFFEPGEEVIIFRTREELLSLVKYYLAHHNEAE